MIVGLTGGIGSGKSTVAGIFSVLGIPIYEADVAAKRLMDEDLRLQSELVDLLGQDLVTDQSINRPLMASRIFNDEELLKQTNALIHPAVARDFRRWYKNHTNCAYVLREAAILFESETYRDCSKIISVVAPEEMRISRVMQRNGVEREAVRQRIKNQWTDNQRISRSDYVIYNDLNQSVIKQVLAIHEDIVSQANT